MQLPSVRRFCKLAHGGPHEFAILAVNRIPRRVTWRGKAAAASASALSPQRSTHTETITMKTPTTPRHPAPATPSTTSQALLIRTHVKAGGLLLPAVQKVR